jgi:alpha-1,2-mannosyltransferase
MARVNSIAIRALAWLPAALIAAVQASAALSRPHPDRLADLHVYVGAVGYLIDGRSLYDFITFNDAPFTYPPFAALLMLPFAYLDEALLRVLWTLLTIAAVVLLAVLIGKVARDRVPARLGPWLAPVSAAVLFGSAPVSSNLRFGQVSVLLALLVIIDVVWVRREPFRGVLTGLTAAIKLTPLIFIPMFWFGGRHRAALTAVATALAATGLAALFLYPDSVRFWGSVIWNVDRVGNIATGGNQSINGALLRLGAEGTARTLVWALLSLIVGAVALWRSSVQARQGDWLSAVIVTGAASVAISPVSWTHHQVWLVLAALLPVAGSARWRVSWPILVLFIMIVPVTSLGGKLPGVLGLVGGELRTLLAVAICVIPLTAPGWARNLTEIRNRQAH